MDYLGELNWWAVIAAAAAGYATCGVWYSQSVFGKAWMKAAGLGGKTKNVKGDKFTVIMLISAITIVITAAALAVLFDVLRLSGVMDGATLGLLVAGGFLVTNNGMHKLYEMRPYMHFSITALGDVASLVVMGAVLGFFK